MDGGSYRLKYFPVAALGEPIRFLLSYAGKDFEDIRIPKDKWLAVKSQMPFGKMPVLEIDGKVLHQSKAILRYLAKSINLAGADDWESLQIDMAVDTIDDLRRPIRYYYRDLEESSKAANRDRLVNEILPLYLERLDAQVQSNGGHLVNGKLSWADFYFAGLINHLGFMAGVDNILGKYSNLEALRNKIFALPKIAGYISKRP